MHNEIIAELIHSMKQAETERNLAIGCEDIESLRKIIKTEKETLEIIHRLKVKLSLE